MSGRLIVIEGADGAGKATQTALLAKRLERDGLNVNTLSFPDYESDSSALIKMYLKGDFGGDANNVSPYAASVFYAADRYASYKKKWQKLYEEGRFFIADRYVTSNLVHQGVKLEGGERDEFIKWLIDLEYNKLALPKPDIVIFLDMPPEMSLKLVKDRGRHDIHENNKDYLRKTYECYKETAEILGWIKIDCARENSVKTVEEINEEVYNACKERLL